MREVKHKGKITLLLFLLSTFFLPMWAVGAIYKKVGPYGTIQFTDRSSEGAKPVELEELQTYRAPPPVVEPEQPVPLTAQQSTRYAYQSIAITTPVNEETIRDTHGNVNVNVAIVPPLQKGDKVAISLDGKVVGEPEATTAFHLTGVYRGTHQLEASVIDAQGNEIIHSEVITFFMHQPRVDMIKKPEKLKPPILNLKPPILNLKPSEGDELARPLSTD